MASSLPFIPWDKCLADFDTNALQNYQAWRGFSLPFCRYLHNERLVGLYVKPKTGINYFCYPIFGPGGAVIAEQIFTQSTTKAKAWMSAGAEGNITPVVLGALPHAKMVFPAESPHDAFAFADRTGLWKDPDSCFIATRGASNDRLLTGLPWPQNNGTANPEIFLLCQNDQANAKWVDRVRPSLPFAYYLWNPPSGIKDFNDWTRAGITESELLTELGKLHTTPPIPPTQNVRSLSGASLVDFSERQIDYSKNLLGNRWLSVEQGTFFVAPSGHGKSTWVIQAAACWACGRTAFGLHPARALRILIIQAEDDNNDVIEMSMLIDRLSLTPEQRESIRKNTHIEWLNNVAGQGFFSVLDDFLSAWPADLLIINPYSAYQGGDIKDDKLNNEFLRIHLSALLTKHQCGALGVHHTPKTQFQKLEDFEWYDWMYSMAGGASLTNWARGVLIMVPSSIPKTYKFIGAKRFEKTGWQDREYWFSHSEENGKILWVPSTQAQIAASKTGGNTTPDDLLSLIPVIDPIPEASILVEAKTKLRIGRDRVRAFLKVLLYEKKIAEHEFPRKNARPEIRYVKT